MRCSRGRGTGARRAPFGRPGGQPLHELQRTHHQVRGAIAPRGLELQLHLPGRVELHPLVRQCRPGDGAAQLFQPLAVMGLDSHRGVQAEAVDVGAQGLARRSLARHCTSQGQQEPFRRVLSDESWSQSVLFAPSIARPLTSSKSSRMPFSGLASQTQTSAIGRAQRYDSRQIAVLRACSCARTRRRCWRLPLTLNAPRIDVLFAHRAPRPRAPSPMSTLLAVTPDSAPRI